MFPETLNELACLAYLLQNGNFYFLVKCVYKSENRRSVHSLGVDPRIVYEGKIGTVDKCVCINQK